MFAKRLKYMRKYRNLSQEELGKKVNSTKGTISNYENEHSTPSNEMLVQLANVLETNTDYLLGRSDSMESQESDEDFEAFRNRPDLEVWYRNLPKSSEEELEMLKEMYEIWRKRNK